MRTAALTSILSLSIALSTTLAAGADTTSDPATIGTTQSMTVSPTDMTALDSATKHYLDSALNNQDAFFASTTDHYQGISLDGKTYSSGQVYGLVQVKKQPLSGLVTRVKIIDAHHLCTTFDETATFNGVADTIDSEGAHGINQTWVHKITFVRDANGNFLVSRDQVLAMN